MPAATLSMMVIVSDQGISAIHNRRRITHNRELLYPTKEYPQFTTARSPQSPHRKLYPTKEYPQFTTVNVSDPSGNNCIRPRNIRNSQRRDTWPTHSLIVSDQGISAIHNSVCGVLLGHVIVSDQGISAIHNQLNPIKRFIALYPTKEYPQFTTRSPQISNTVAYHFLEKNFRQQQLFGYAYYLATCLRPVFDYAIATQIHNNQRTSPHHSQNWRS